MNKYQNLVGRRAVPTRPLTVREQYEELQENEDVRYLLGSMEPLDAVYTQQTLKEAERVYRHFEPFSTVRLQGSVKTNTHIRYHSDIDVLTLTNDFVSWEQKPATVSTYAGDPVATLKTLRQKSRATVQREFPAVKIEDKNRALRLSGGSLQRNMDVVTANWHNTITYTLTQEEKDRGIHVLDVSDNSRIFNKPFLHEYKLNQKNAITGDGLGRAVRLLKNLKADATTPIGISSYDIGALVWNMDSTQLHGSPGASFQLAQNCADFLRTAVDQDGARLRTFWVPNETRRIIDPKEGASVRDVLLLWHELHLLLESIKRAGKALDRRYNIANRSLQLIY